MRTFRHRITASLAGLAYLLASAFSGALHLHAHGEPHSHGPCCAPAAGHGHSGHAADSHDCLADVDVNDGHEHTPCPQPLSDDHCAACRFVSQAAVISVPDANLKPQSMVAEVRPRAPSFVIQPPIRGNCLARAPPLG